MLHQMTSLFNSGFYFPGYNWTSILLAIAIGISFGAVWLFLYHPPLLKNTWLWNVAVISAILTWTSVAFIQTPLQSWTKQLLVNWWNPRLISTSNFILLSSIPILLIAGIVQEAAILAPVFFFRQRSKRDFTPQSGLIAGATAGAGFGIFEAIWKLNLMLPDIGFLSSLTNKTLHYLAVSGFSYMKYSLLGSIPIMGVFGGFYSIVFHISSAALMGYGLAKRRGWQYFLLAAFLNGLVNFGAFLWYLPRITMIEGIIWVMVPVILVTGVMLWLRWHKPKVKPAVSISSALHLTLFRKHLSDNDKNILESMGG